MINPYHIQPGLILDVDIISVKRKKATLNAMANVLNEFLHGVSQGFQDAAFASFSRRRSTVRDDINQSFGAAEGGSPKPAKAPAASYLDMINSDESAADAPAVLPAPAKRGRAPAKAAAAPAPKKRGRKPGSGRKG
jgi:hypothetical protein